MAALLIGSAMGSGLGGALLALLEPFEDFPFFPFPGFLADLEAPFFLT